MNFRSLTVFALLAASAALADDSPQNAARYRHVVMEGVGDHMKASALVVKGEVGRTADLKAHAKAMNDAAQYFDQLFPKGSGPDVVPKSNALPKIWEDWEGFVKANETFKKASADFLAATESGEMEKIKPAFGALGKSCGGCHDTYRKDEEH
ncbi:MAG: cytochrome c [Alphaproteobacteria bacterium]|nr:cytochrome c [Alphaproteobacteria bacterium]